MNKTKVAVFLNNLRDIIKTLDTTEVKDTIGDSINNNRTLTVNQVIRYLVTRRNPKLKALGTQLSAVYYTIGKSALEMRYNNRTDALDINELILALSITSICGSTQIKKSLASRIRNA